MNKFKQEVFKYPNALTFRPFRNYELIKLEGRGNVWVAVCFICIMGLLYSLSYNATGFIVNDNNAIEYNGLGQFLGFVLPVALLIVSNWSVTTLMNGKGKIREITMVAGYCMYPLIIMYIIAMVYSNIMIFEETYLYYLLLNIGILFSAFNMLAGLIIVHEYSLKQALYSIFLTIVSFIIILFVIFLLFSLYLQIVDFIATFSRELSQRLGG